VPCCFRPASRLKHAFQSCAATPFARNAAFTLQPRHYTNARVTRVGGTDSSKAFLHVRPDAALRRVAGFLEPQKLLHLSQLFSLTDFEAFRLNESMSEARTTKCCRGALAKTSARRN